MLTEPPAAPIQSEAVGVEPRVRALVAAHCSVAPGTLRPDVRLDADLALDSLATIDLAMALEDEFDIALSDEALSTLLTYDDVVAAVTTRFSSH